MKPKIQNQKIQNDEKSIMHFKAKTERRIATRKEAKEVPTS